MSAVNKKPQDFRRRPDAGADDIADRLLESIENLDMLLANMKNGQKE